MHVWNLWGSVPPTRLRTTALKRGAAAVRRTTATVGGDLISVRSIIILAYSLLLSPRFGLYAT